MRRYHGLILGIGIVFLVMTGLSSLRASSVIEHGGVNRDVTPTICTPEPPTSPTQLPTNTPPETPTPQETPTPDATDTPEPTASPTDTGEPTETPTEGPTDTPNPTDTPTAEATSSPTPEVTDTPESSATPTPFEPTATPTIELTPSQTPGPSNTPWPTTTPVFTYTPVEFTPTPSPPAPTATDTPHGGSGTSTPSCECEISVSPVSAGLNLNGSVNVTLTLEPGQQCASGYEWHHNDPAHLTITEMSYGVYTITAVSLPRDMFTTYVHFTYSDGYCQAGECTVTINILYEGTPAGTSTPFQTPTFTPSPPTGTPNTPTPTNTPHGSGGPTPTPAEGISIEFKSFATPSFTFDHLELARWQDAYSQGNVKTNAFNDDPDAFVVFVEDSNANPGLPIYVSISTSGDTATLVQCNPESNGAFRSGPLALIYGDTDNQFAAYNIPNNEVDDRTHSVFPGGMLTVEYEPDNSPVVTISSDIPLVNTITYDVIILEYPPGTPCVESGTTSQHEIYAEERFAQCEVSIIRMQQDCHPCPDDVDLADGLSSQEYTVLGNHFRGPEYCYTSQIQIFYVNYFTENPDYGGIARTNEDLIAISSVQAVQSTTTHELAHVTSGYGDMGILTYLVLCQNSNRPPNLEEWEFRCRFLQAHENAIKSYQGNRE